MKSGSSSGIAEFNYDFQYSNLSDPMSLSKFTETKIESNRDFKFEVDRTLSKASFIPPSDLASGGDAKNTPEGRYLDLMKLKPGQNRTHLMPNLINNTNLKFLLIVAFTGAAKTPSNEKWTLRVNKLIDERGDIEKTQIDVPVDSKIQIPTEKSFVKCFLNKRTGENRIVSCSDGVLLMKASCDSKALEFSLEGSEKTSYFVKIKCEKN